MTEGVSCQILGSIPFWEVCSPERSDPNTEDEIAAQDSPKVRSQTAAEPCTDATSKGRRRGVLRSSESALQKYLEVMQLPTTKLPFIDLNQEIDFDFIEQASVSES